MKNARLFKMYINVLYKLLLVIVFKYHHGRITSVNRQNEGSKFQSKF